MKLNFEIMNQYDNNVNFVNEPDNLFTKYFKKGRHVVNESVRPYRGDNDVYKELDYTDLQFENEPSRLTTEAVSAFGVKNFPQYGSYGWYTTLYSKRTKVLAPVNKKRSTYHQPQINVDQTEELVTLTITDPVSVSYDCYRIEVRYELFATEFVTYERTFSFVPMYTGPCTITIIGHRNDIAISSLPLEYEIVLVDKTPAINTSEATQLTGTLSVDDWVENEQVIEVLGITMASIVFVAPIPTSQGAYTMAGILCTAQASNSLTFTCAQLPLVDIEIGVVFL